MYGVIFILLLLLEILYFKVAKIYGIVDKPNNRSSHSFSVLRGGGIIFLLGTWVWSLFFGFHYICFLIAVTLVGAISFLDDICSLNDSVRLIIQFVAMFLLFYQLDMLQLNLWWAVLIGLIVCVGATNVINFMDGINGLTAGYSLTVMIPLVLVNIGSSNHFIEQSFLIVAILSLLVFSWFNFRPRGKAKCFAGDVGSISIAFIILFSIGKLIMQTSDITWFILLIVYGVDGCLTILHRILLHENLGEAHRKHAYQIMANELGLAHPLVCGIYMLIQLLVSLGFIYICPNEIWAHWIYLLCSFIVLSVIYLLFMKRFYHLHEEYLKSLKPL